jgi:hypothetical protein
MVRRNLARGEGFAKPLDNQTSETHKPQRGEVSHSDSNRLSEGSFRKTGKRFVDFSLLRRVAA